MLRVGINCVGCHSVTHSFLRAEFSFRIRV